MSPYSLPPISLPSTPMSRTYHIRSNSMQERYSKEIRLPSFQELSCMIESSTTRQDIIMKDKVVVVPLLQRTKKSSNSCTRTSKQKQTEKKYRHIKKKPTPQNKQNKCHSCDSTETPEWRKGPLGPRTLCNACGLIWTKLCKQYENEAPVQEEDNNSKIQPLRISLFLQ